MSVYSTFYWVGKHKQAAIPILGRTVLLQCKILLSQTNVTITKNRYQTLPFGSIVPNQWHVWSCDMPECRLAIAKPFNASVWITCLWTKLYYACLCVGVHSHRTLQKTFIQHLNCNLRVKGARILWLHFKREESTCLPRGQKKTINTSKV